MNVIAFDTCLTACSVAVRAERPGVPPQIATEHHAMATGHAEALLPMIERAMREADLAFPDLQRIVVTNGPGTFTGIRTGVAVARALALATGAQIVAVSSLWALAVGALQAADPEKPIDSVLAAVDARKGQIYYQVFDPSGRELSEPLLGACSAAADLCTGKRVLIVGNAAAALIELSLSTATTSATVCEASLAPDEPNAIHLLAAALRSSITGPLGPHYLRPPDAKPQAGKSLPWSQS
jgi:tRNA threonylcarbamoyladenosine biosynthesis protein TsaB